MDRRRQSAKRRLHFAKRLSDFAVSRCPSYRRLPVFRHTVHATTSSADAPALRCAAPVDDDDSELWQRLMGSDIRALATEILVHICGESCFKYSIDSSAKTV